MLPGSHTLVKLEIIGAPSRSMKVRILQQEIIFVAQSHPEHLCNIWHVFKMVDICLRFIRIFDYIFLMKFAAIIGYSIVDIKWALFPLPFLLFD